jgi:hypothetical protein
MMGVAKRAETTETLEQLNTLEYHGTHAKMLHARIPTTRTPGFGGGALFACLLLQSLPVVSH